MLIKQTHAFVVGIYTDFQILSYFVPRLEVLTTLPMGKFSSGKIFSGFISHLAFLNLSSASLHIFQTL